MNVHLHTVCWNDRRMLDFFFRHFEPWVTHFYVYDDGSDDGSREYLEARPDVTVERLTRINPDSWVASAKHIYDTSWKRSADADWVVVGNIDEHLHHADMKAYLARCAADGVTVVPSLGYQMVSERFPAPESLLWRDCVMGAPWRKMSKLQIFNPRVIRESNFGAGRHRAAFEGEIVLPARDEVANLHYKYLGLEETHARQSIQGERLGALDRENGWGHQYHWDKARLAEDFELRTAQLVNITGLDHHVAHAEPRWWRNEKIDAR